MTERTIKIQEQTKYKFDKLQLDLKIKYKKYVTQDELVNILMNVFKERNKPQSINFLKGKEAIERLRK